MEGDVALSIAKSLNWSEFWPSSWELATSSPNRKNRTRQVVQTAHSIIVSRWLADGDHSVLI